MLVQSLLMEDRAVVDYRINDPKPRICLDKVYAKNRVRATRKMEPVSAHDGGFWKPASREDARPAVGATTIFTVIVSTSPAWEAMAEQFA